MIGNIVAGLQDPGLIAVGDFESIATVTVGSGGSALVTFSNIPQIYQHLQIRIFARATNASSEAYVKLNLNNVTTANYTYHNLLGDGSSATSASDNGGTVAIINRMTGGTATASIFGTMIIDILDYNNTNKLKTIRSLGGFDVNGSGKIYLNSTVLTTLTAAITEIDLAPNTDNFAEHSSIALYGIKG